MTLRQNGIVLRQLRTLYTVGAVGGLTDGQLVKLFATGHGETAELAFAALVERHGPVVLRVCRAVLRDEHDAQDAFQASFLVLMRKAGSLQVQASIGPWLHQVAYRAASCARADADRRRRHERRAAAMVADRVQVHASEDLRELEEILHEEIGRLPRRYRIPVVLCDLEGCTQEQAAQRLGCPVGTVKSRLTRGRTALRQRLVRRGLAPPAGLPGALPFANVVPNALAETTIRSALSITAGRAATGAVPGAVVSLTKGVLRTMFQAKLRMLAIPFLAAIVAVGAGLLVSGPRTTATALNGAADEPDDEPGPRPGVDHVDRLDLGKLQVGALAETEVGIRFQGIKDRDLAIRADGPDFATVKDLRVLRRGEEKPGEVFCSVILAIDTERQGKQSGKLRVHLGDQVAKVPVVADVTPREPGRTKVLVVSTGFGSASNQVDFYRPWFNLVDEAKLDVSYKECYPYGLHIARNKWKVDENGRILLAEELERYDVILLAEGGTIFLKDYDITMLERFVESGKRLIVTANLALVDSVLRANRVLDPFGMTLLRKAVGRRGNRPIEVTRIVPDPLTKGIAKLTTDRPVPIHIQDADQAKVLAFLPGSEDGFVAVSRPKEGEGEVIAIGLREVSSWIGKYGEGADNARFLRNLLSKRLNRRDNP